MKAKLIKRKDGSYKLKFNNDNDMMSCSLGLLSLKNCQSIERGYDLDELAETHHKLQYCDGYNPNIAPYVEGDYKAGFQKALELMGDKKYSEDDIEKAIVHHTYLVYNDGLPKYRDYFDDRINKVIQSLQQTEWDVEIVQEEGKDTFGNAELTWYNPKLNADVCLILKRI